jgi:hypothetical protein
MATVYLDESGYTGEDLIQPDQPVFVICTHSIDETSCTALKARHFLDVKATELKHSRLAGRPRQAKMLIAALKDLATNYGEQILVGISDKRFSLLSKIVDLVIETSMYQAGFNLYKDGGNIAMANVMYACMGLDPRYLDRMLRAFQKWMRERSIQRQHELNHLLRRPHSIEPVDHFRQMILGALLRLRYVGVFKRLQRGALDLSFSTAINLMGMWRTKLGDEPIDLVHDQSSNMAKQKQLWDVLVSPNTPPALVGHDTRTMRFPLGVTGTGFVDGRTNSGLQIADIIAGATATLAASRLTGARSEYLSDLEGLFTGGGFKGYEYLPSLDYTPEALGTTGQGGVDPLEYMGKLMEAAKLLPDGST